MNEEFKRMQELAGLITESYDRFEDQVKAISTDSTIKDEISHKKSGLEVKLYNGGAIQYCKNNKMITAFKFTNKNTSDEAFEKIKTYFNENPNEEITPSILFSKLKFQYLGTILNINSNRSNACGVEGIKSISWAR
jgi:hypothetical protein